MNQFRKPTLPLVALFACAVAAPVVHAAAAESWDGLVEVRSKRFDAAWVAPGADLRPYAKVMLDPTEASFRPDWLRNVNQGRSLADRVSPERAERILAAARTNFADVFAEELGRAGYEIVTAPGPSVLRVSPSITNLYVNAPDPQGASSARTYAANAGEAKMVLEVRDSVSNALLARVVDERETRENFGLQQASRLTNESDFRGLFRSWAAVSARGLESLKALSPVPETLQPRQKLD